MTSRAEQKRGTRRALIEAALRMGAQKGFSSLSLRAVTREAGVAPTAFYRHFPDMEHLGLALADEVGLALRQLVREARLRTAERGHVVRTSIETFMEQVAENEDLFRLLLGEGAGSTPAIRRAVQKEIGRFTQDLIEDLEAKGRAERRPVAHLPLVAEAMVTVAFHLGAASIDLSDAQRKDVTERIIREVRIIMLGAEAMAAGYKPTRLPQGGEPRGR